VRKGPDHLCADCALVRKGSLKRKEDLVAATLTAAGIPFVRDRVLEGSHCGLERPDFQIDCGAWFVYVECDEGAHGHISRECEVVRMRNLAEARAMPVVFVRFNPDPVFHADVRAVDRHRQLAETTVRAMQEGPGPLAVVAVIWLYFDGDAERQEILITA
jgi:hypothetical protein